MAWSVRLATAIGLIQLAVLLVAAESRAGGGEAFPSEADSLATDLERAGQAAAGRAVREHFFERDPRRQYAFLIPRSTRLPVTGSSADEWQKRWTEMRARRADRLFDEARDLVGRDPGASYRLLREALYENPQHARVREVLDMPSRASSTSRLRTRRPTSTHPWFGWSPRAYWFVESPHFVIVSHLRGSAPRALATKLEDLYAVWQQVFFDSWSDGRWLADRFRGRPVPTPRVDRFQIVLFRDHDDYLKSLADVEPAIRESLGYYVPRRKTSFFFSARVKPWETFYHEVSHQLFQETSGGIQDPGERGHIWAVEGLALYMESLRFFDAYATVGGFDARRLQYARYRRLRANYYVPTQELVGIGREAFQQRDDVRKLYSQCAGLAHYLMDGESGKLRPGFVHYAAGLYQGREDRDLLTASLQRAWRDIDAGYREFLRVSDADLKFVGPTESVKQLSLGGTRVTARGLRRLSGLRDLEWLDLAGLPLADADVGWVAKNRKLAQLMLERTGVDDRIAAVLAPLTSLVELDLSGTHVGDDTAAVLGELTNLESLWLSDTLLTDRGLARLARLKRLRVLDIEGTKVTKAGIARLRAALPRLEQIDGP